MSGGKKRTCALSLSVAPPIRKTGLPRMAPRRHTRGSLHLTGRSSVHGTCITAVLARRHTGATLTSFRRRNVTSARRFIGVLITSQKGCRALLSFQGSTARYSERKLTLPLLRRLSTGS